MCRYECRTCRRPWVPWKSALRKKDIVNHYIYPFEIISSLHSKVEQTAQVLRYSNSIRVLLEYSNIWTVFEYCSYTQVFEQYSSTARIVEYSNSVRTVFELHSPIIRIHGKWFEYTGSLTTATKFYRCKGDLRAGKSSRWCKQFFTSFRSFRARVNFPLSEQSTRVQKFQARNS